MAAVSKVAVAATPPVFATEQLVPNIPIILAVFNVAAGARVYLFAALLAVNELMAVAPKITVPKTLNSDELPFFPAAVIVTAVLIVAVLPDTMLKTTPEPEPKPEPIVMLVVKIADCPDIVLKTSPLLVKLDATVPPPAPVASVLQLPTVLAAATFAV